MQLTRQVSVRTVLIYSGLVLALAGCAGGATDKPKTASVSGSVTLEGQPLTDATVTFLSSGGKGNPGTGTTDSQGKFKLATTANEGAVPGSYKVVIEAYRKPDGTPLEISDGMDVEQLKAAGKAKQILPEKYSSPDITELKAEVVAGKDNVFDFPLKSGGGLN